MVSILFKWCSILLFPLLFPVQHNSLNHPVYISVTEIEHNSKDKTLEISCKIFTDDFEKTLRKTYNTYVDLINPKDRKVMDKLVNDYVQKHLKIDVDGKQVNLQYLGFEQVEEGIYSYYQADNISTPKKISVTDNILYEYKSEQISLLHVIVNGSRKSTKLVNPDAKAVMVF